MKIHLYLGMAAAFLAFATAAFAYPNLNATTGLIGVPTASIVSRGTVTGAADVLFTDDEVVNARVLFGLGDHIEGGVAAVFGDDSALVLNAKYQFAPMPAGFNWAAGLAYVTSDDSGDGYQLYFVGSKTIVGTPTTLPNLRGTLGVTFTNLEDSSGIRPFVGGQVFFSPRTELGGEFELEAGDFSESIFSLYLRQQFTDRLGGQLGVTNANGFTGMDDHDFFLGLAYTFAGTATLDVSNEEAGTGD